MYITEITSINRSVAKSQTSALMQRILSWSSFILVLMYYLEYNYGDARVKRSKCRSCLHDKAFELVTRKNMSKQRFT